MTTPPIRLGILVPSSNTALEPLTTALLSTLPSPKITVHFSRFPVTSISLTPSALSQFDLGPILSAAELLAHAGVSVIGWSGTSAGWLGFDRDEELCERIREATGVPATTSVLALNKAVRAFGVERLGLVTPYTGDVQERIVANYEGLGDMKVVVERHLGIQDNREIAAVGANVWDGLVGEVVEKGLRVQGVMTFCTNLSVADRVAGWEKKFGVPVFDTVATVVWDMLKMVGVDVRGVKGWGRLFDEEG